MNHTEHDAREQIRAWIMSDLNAHTQTGYCRTCYCPTHEARVIAQDEHTVTLEYKCSQCNQAFTEVIDLDYSADLEADYKRQGF